MTQPSTAQYSSGSQAPNPAVAGGSAVVPLDVLDEAYRVLAAWSTAETVPPQWQERMARAAQRLYNHGARAASERVRRVAHQHEDWQLLDRADGGKYCGACGERVGCSCTPNPDTGDLYDADGWRCSHG